MKRFLVVLLALVMSLMTVVVAEESDVDLSGKTVDELVAMRNAIDDALFEQGGKVVLPIGQYVVGKDIAAGSYVIEIHGVNKAEVRSYDYFRIQVWKSEDAMSEYQAAYNEYSAQREQAWRDKEEGKEYEYPVEVNEAQYISFQGNFSVDDSARITLDEGQVLLCNSDMVGTMTIEKAIRLFMD